ncbi:lyase family protein [Streptomyces sp. NPDC058092]|uniref:lyase family protein n=1 Tax=Streptomyces sp. NPDC058092 TaxID=3346336 RepID=UPI0036E05801
MILGKKDEQRPAEACGLIREINLGGTAIGTGFNSPPRYAELVCSYLSEITGIPLSTASDLVEAIQDV